MKPASAQQLGLDIGSPPTKEAPKKKIPPKKKVKRKVSVVKPAAPASPTKSAPTPANPPEHVSAPPAAAASPPSKEESKPAPNAAEPLSPAPSNPSLGLDLEPPSKRSEKKPPKGVVLAPLDLAGGAAREKLALAKKRLEEGSPEEAALLFDAILRDPALAEAHDEARYQRAKALALLGMNHSALAGFDEVLDRGPGGSRFFHSALEWIFYVGRNLKNEQPVLSRVARYGQAGFPPGQEDRFHLLLAKYQFERGRALREAGRAGEAQKAFDEAQRLAGLVRESAGAIGEAKAEKEQKDSTLTEGTISAEGGDTFARARFLTGLVLYAKRDEEGAMSAFKDVVKLQNVKRQRRSDAEVKELALLQLARIHYENRQNRYAIFYYSRMPWGGERWLEGLWEASYAYYRVGDYEKTLGNLLTLQSPYFADEYFPESYVLEAVVYYENCRYPEARRVLETFGHLYEPLYDELARLTARESTPSEFAELVSKSGRPGAPALARRIAKLATTDQDLARLDQTLAEIDFEVSVSMSHRSKAFRDSPLAAEMADRLRAERSQLADEAGLRARGKLEYERDQLRTLLAQALRIQIEVSHKEREALEGSLAVGSQVEVVRDLKYSTAVSDEHLYWPYEGEFWRDELGTFTYTFTKGCKDRLNRVRTTAAP